MTLPIGSDETIKRLKIKLNNPQCGQREGRKVPFFAEIKANPPIYALGSMGAPAPKTKPYSPYKPSHLKTVLCNNVKEAIKYSNLVLTSHANGSAVLSFSVTR